MKLQDLAKDRLELANALIRAANKAANPKAKSSAKPKNAAKAPVQA